MRLISAFSPSVCFGRIANCVSLGIKFFNKVDNLG